MTIQSLQQTPIEELTQCFNEAFANYYVPFNATPAYLEHRWHGSGVDLNLSFGVFDKGRLVAFIINAFDPWEGYPTAYNAGTGVIPQYRGQRLVKQLYEECIPKLKAAGIQQICLEVICQNEKAIKAYQSIGMKIGRKLHCFSGEIQPPRSADEAIVFKKNMLAQWPLYQQFWDFNPAWDHSIQSIERLRKDFTVYELYLAQECCAYAIINPQNGAIPQFAVAPQHRGKELGKNLFHHLTKVRPKLKLNNVDAASTATIQFLTQLGLKNTIDQYEMSALIV